jgi:transcriptional regulator with XRE-family HTH domain
MASEATIGQRIAAYRRRRGLSQAALAGLVGKSESWLSQVERGIRSIDRLSVLLDLAKILHVEVDALTGRPWHLAPNGGPLVEGLDDVRRALSRYSHVVGDVAAPSMSLRDLRTEVFDLHSDYQAARYKSVIHRLPSLLVAADEIHADVNASNRRETLLVYVSAYVAGAKLLTKLGAGDMAALAADRAAMTAGSTESLVSQGMAIYQVVCALLRADRTDEGEQLAIRMAERLTSHVRSDAPSVVSVTGALWLIAAVIAARRTDRGASWERLDTAERLAGLLGRDGNFAWTAFGPTNVAIHRVSVAAELGNPADA